MTNFFENNYVLRILVRWKKHLMIIVGSSIVISALLSSPLFIKPKFKSTAIIYPSNLIPYSSETPTEQMLQLLQSVDIRDAIIKKFNLADHYDIDTTAAQHYSNLTATYEENVVVKKTEYESVKIEVLDTDPKMACDMASAIINLFNQKTRSLQREKSYEVLNIFRNQLSMKKSEMDSLDNLTKKLRVEFGLLDYDIQTEGVTVGFFDLMSKGKLNPGIQQEIDNLKKNLQEKGGDLISLKEHLWRIRGTYNDLKISYENAAKDVSKELTYTNVVTKPFPADKKSYPIRWLIVLLTASSTFFFSFLIITIIDSDKPTF